MKNVPDTPKGTSNISKARQPTHSPIHAATESLLSDTQSERSTTALLHNQDSEPKPRVGDQAKSMWQKLKEDDQKRKDNVQHVSHAEATTITGRDEAGAKVDGKEEHGKGDKRMLGALFFG
ncbi:Nn.00g018890.m01.CDS01 [Neocucurbitaria sp. VM-36]